MLFLQWVISLHAVPLLLCSLLTVCSWLALGSPQQFTCISRRAFWEMKFWVAEFSVPFKLLGHCITSKCEIKSSSQNKVGNACYFLSVFNLVNLLEGKRVGCHGSFPNEVALWCRNKSVLLYEYDCNIVHFLTRSGLLPAKENKRLFPPPFFFFFATFVSYQVYV